MQVDIETNAVTIMKYLGHLMEVTECHSECDCDFFAPAIIFAPHNGKDHITIIHNPFSDNHAFTLIPNELGVFPFLPVPPFDFPYDIVTVEVLLPRALYERVLSEMEKFIGSFNYGKPFVYHLANNRQILIQPHEMVANLASAWYQEDQAA